MCSAGRGVFPGPLPAAAQTDSKLWSDDESAGLAGAGAADSRASPAAQPKVEREMWSSPLSGQIEEEPEEARGRGGSGGAGRPPADVAHPTAPSPPGGNAAAPGLTATAAPGLPAAATRRSKRAGGAPLESWRRSAAAKWQRGRAAVPASACAQGRPGAYSCTTRNVANDGALVSWP